MKIDSYKFGEIVIDGKVFHQDVILFSDNERIFSPWWRKKGHLLLKEDLDEVLKGKPEILVIGTGAAEMMKVPGEIKDFIKNQGIELFVLNTKEACDKFNELTTPNLQSKFGGPRKVVAAFHLTC